MMKKISLVYVLSLSLVLSCSSEKEQQNTNLMQFPEYAEGFAVKKNKNYTQISVFNPSQNSKEQSFDYFLVKKNSTFPDSLKNRNIIKVPVKNAICLSTTFLGFIEEINERKTITGISGTKYVYDTLIREMIKNNKIKEIGSVQNLDIEKIITIKPEVVFAYDIDGSLSSKLKILDKFDIQVVLIGEYLENHPLGRAEWIEFFGYFYAKDSLAKIKFNKIEKAYKNLTDEIPQKTDKPGIVLNIPFQGIWYLPGGKSYMAKLIEDAGGNYLWNNNKKNESFSVNLEEIFLKNDSIDILINPGNAKSIQDILKTDKRLKNLNCIKSKSIFNNNKRCSKSGGNDFWESGAVKPHLILKDLIFIFNNKTDSLYYYQKID